jgi:uridylate kinase
MKVVMALGGSVLVPDKLDEGYMREFAGMIKPLAEKNEIAIVTGGGKTARRWIEEARRSGANEVECDYLGIKASRDNARMLCEVLEITNTEIPRTLEDAAKMVGIEKIVVMGGTEPGHSTDAVATLLAELINADLILKVTDVDGIYDRDPQKFKDAKMFDKLPIDKLEKMVSKLSQKAGKYELMDLVAVSILKRSGIKCIALNGRDLANMKKVIEGKKVKGTVIQ